MLEIIKSCQELKELGLDTADEGLNYEDLDILVENIPPNIEGLNLRSSPGYTVSRKVSGKQVIKYPDIQFQRNFLKFLKVSQKS